MKHRLQLLLLCLGFVFAALWIALPAHATVPWTAEQIAEYERTHPPLPFSPERLERPGASLGTLDDPVYFEEFVQTCNFLTTLQNFNPGTDYGGMREGEVGSDFNIIQTDNTQEAIRDWCQYALWTGDTATFSANVRAAWVYCNIHTAWTEESEGGIYYRDHNCGWGIEAAILFLAAYGDTSQNVYADGCCAHMANHDFDGTNLACFAYALGLGGMYQWAVYRNHQDWISHAIQQGFALRDWLSESPARIRSTSWALSGGTAVWGLCRSLFAAYPDTGRAWVQEYGEQLPMASEVTASSWYNSFKCWNSNATYACYELTDNPVFLNRVADYAEDLLSFDVDDDGGIPPGTCCIEDANDHSWVSAYMAWMALGNMIGGVSRFISPDPSVPYPAGVPLPVVVEVQNPRLESASGSVQITGYEISATAPFNIEGGASIELPITQPWELPDDNTLPEENSLTLIVELIYPAETLVDTTITQFDIRRQIDIAGEIRGEFDEMEMPPCRIEFSNIERPDTVYVPFPTQTGITYTSGDVPLFTGDVRIRVIPPVRYTLKDTIVNIQTVDQTELIDLFLTTTELVLVDDDNGAAYETYVAASLDSLGFNTRVWDQTLESLTDPDFVQTMIWLTGGDAQSGPAGTVIDAQEQTLIESFLNSGGKLLLSGQDITDVLRDEPFLSDILHCTADDDSVNRIPIGGTGLDPVFGNVYIVLGSGGAASNQYSTSSMVPLESAETILLFPMGETAAIKGIHGAGRFIFTGFGIEGIPFTSSFTDRTEFIDLCLDWLNETARANDLPPLLPESIALYQNYPNPFNPTTTIQFYAPPGTASLSLIVYDILGREVVSLLKTQPERGMISVEWDGRTNSGRPVSSGTYIYKLTGSNKSISRSMKLLR
ncbi:T9SS type A sorting domain-containing protein [bacterium]|nr:T9SS type A sorting domain-containing protein [bacterium]